MGGNEVKKFANYSDVGRAVSAVNGCTDGAIITLPVTGWVQGVKLD